MIALCIFPIRNQPPNLESLFSKTKMEFIFKKGLNFFKGCQTTYFFKNPLLRKFSKIFSKALSLIFGLHLVLSELTRLKQVRWQLQIFSKALNQIGYFSECEKFGCDNAFNRCIHTIVTCLFTFYP